MADYVKLSQIHLDQLIDTLQLAVDYKAKSLSKSNWETFASDYLPKAISAIKENKFKVADVHNNILTWVVDNIVPSRKVVEGLPKKDWIPLIDIESVQSTLSMLRAASRGQMSYNIYASNNTTYQDLFQ
jgi:hypothetical protein